MELDEWIAWERQARRERCRRVSRTSIVVGLLGTAAVLGLGTNLQFLVMTIPMVAIHAIYLLATSPSEPPKRLTPMTSRAIGVSTVR